MLRALSIKFDAPFADLAQETIEEGVFHIIPRCRRVPWHCRFGREDDSIRVGMIDPRDIEMRHFLKASWRTHHSACDHDCGLAKALAQYK